MDSNLLPFTPGPIEYERKDNSCHIKVIGVGGGGNNAVNHMFTQGIYGVDFFVCNTDIKPLKDSPVPNKIVLGELGAGNDPEKARKAAMEHKDEIREAISNNTQMLFITAGMGGGTGTGASPVIAETAKSIPLDDPDVPNILVVAIVTTPFTFEGPVRLEQAQKGIEALKSHVDSILVINNDKLRELGKMKLSQAFNRANEVLLTAAKGISEIITRHAYVNIDFRDVNTVMAKSGTALMGAGEGRGENRAMDAIEQATTSVLLNDNDIRGAKKALLYFSYSPEYEIDTDEMLEASEYVGNLIKSGDKKGNIIWGAGEDSNIPDDTLKITLIATGFTPKESGNVIDLDELERKLKENKENASQPKAEETEETEDVEKVKFEGPYEIKHKEEQEPKVHDYKADEIDPLSQPASAGERRVIHLDPSTLEAEEVKEAEAIATPASTQQTGDRMIDGIGLKASEMKAQLTAEAVATEEKVAEAQPRMQSALDSIRPEATRQAQPAKAPETTPDNYRAVSNNVERAFEPQPAANEGLSTQVLDKSERIKRMNEILHNHPNVGQILDTLTIDEISSQRFMNGAYSAMREAGKKTIASDGSIVENLDIFGNMPD